MTFTVAAAGQLGLTQTNVNTRYTAILANLFCWAHQKESIALSKAHVSSIFLFANETVS